MASWLKLTLIATLVAFFPLAWLCYRVALYVRPDPQNVRAIEAERAAQVDAGEEDDTDAALADSQRMIRNYVDRNVIHAPTNPSDPQTIKAEIARAREIIANQLHMSDAMQDEDDEIAGAFRP